MLLHYIMPGTLIVHDWIVDLGGAEQCLKSIYKLYPGDLFTLLYKRESVLSLGISEERVTNSFIQNLPFAKKRYRNYLPFFPLAIEQFDVSKYDLIISSSHAVAKGVLPNANQLHICYCYTPMRYAWDLYHQYIRSAGLDRGLKGKFARSVLHYLRAWDLSTVNRVDYFIAISHYIAKRIERVYKRQSTVIYPPVDVDCFTLCTNKEEYYVAASRMVAYKKMDLIVEAFSMMPDKKLVVVGDGPDFKKIKRLATKNVEVLGYQPTDSLKDILQKAKAFIFAADEDFGILPIEAQACGTPVIAYGRGGVTETVIDGETGLFFSEQSAESICDAVNRFEAARDNFDPEVIRKNAGRFSRQRFETEFRLFVEGRLPGCYSSSVNINGETGAKDITA